MLDPFLLLLARAALGGLMLAAALHKLSEPARFADAVDGYRLVPAPLIRPTAWAIMLAELAAALAVLWPVGEAWRAGLGGVAGLMLAYAAAMAINLLRGRSNVDCGCLGFGAAKRIRWAMVGRGGALAAVSALVALAPAAVRPLLWIDWFGVGVGLLCVLLLYIAFDAIIGAPLREKAR
ncbi:MauE/DoxX family redox-associated membrane protein [Sphingomonas flavalba]|uniref:MauE/DoxX family redox-associated membrane protein n=1 Tax=Sphingomonas flavalba TaxID=2559804 RepID=UPI00109DB8E8|nr:MauE/DoxX family redox-associated membrane protein [Sphingomonas flavalba]